MRCHAKAKVKSKKAKVMTALRAELFFYVSNMSAKFLSPSS
jgi:hypothetical protein